MADFSLEKSANTSKNDIDSLDSSQLLALHARIEAKLTGLRLSDVNLEKETLLQFQRAKVLQEDANKKDSGVPMNQRAQVQNSIAGILGTLSKMQSELHDSESIKRMKAAVVKVVRTLPKEAQAQFFELLEIEFQQAQAEMAT